MEYDFGGYATKNNLRCSDGRTIMHGAFAGNDGQTVPLVWQHMHDDPNNVLGHALLENREDGVYAYCTFNNTQPGQQAKALVRHGDVDSLSIYANQLKQRGNDVLHGVIREVSLVLSGANPGARIDNIAFAHSDGSLTEVDDEVVIYTGEEISPAFGHADSPQNGSDSSDEETIGDVWNTLTEKQQQAVAAIIGMALSEGNGKSPDISHASTSNSSNSDEETIGDVWNTLTEKQQKVVAVIIGMAIEEAKKGKKSTNSKTSSKSNDISEGDTTMKHNVFEGPENTADSLEQRRADFAEALAGAKRYGSLKESVIQHGMDLNEINNKNYLSHASNADGTTQTYGMSDIDYLFPEYRNVTKTPTFVSRRMEWVSSVMNGVSHTPFSRIKSLFADITADEARAKGYIKGNEKLNEVFTLLKRTTDPQTVYKKQKLDRDDVLDITDFDIVAWLRQEMRTMLDEELARAFLVGDGRESSAEDKIAENHIRPIWTDDDFYTIKSTVSTSSDTTDAQLAKAVIEAAIRSRVNYYGSGNPTFFTTEEMLAEMMLLTDNEGRDLYQSTDDLARKMRVKNIVTVPVMVDQTRTTEDGETASLLAIIVNLKDYTVGADKGGSINLFDDFDIDYNQMKYLIETRCSGALTVPYSAIAIEAVEATEEETA